SAHGTPLTVPPPSPNGCFRIGKPDSSGATRGVLLMTHCGLPAMHRVVSSARYNHPNPRAGIMVGWGRDDGTQHRASEIGTMLLLSNVEEESKPEFKVDGNVPIFATRLAFVEGSTGEVGDFMDRMHRIIVALALGSSVLGGIALASLTVGGP